MQVLVISPTFGVSFFLQPACLVIDLSAFADNIPDQGAGDPSRYRRSNASPAADSLFRPGSPFSAQCCRPSPSLVERGGQTASWI
jgi:hypothetical protein